MKQDEIEVGSIYRAKVSGNLVNVKVLSELRPKTTGRRQWLVKNLATGREVAMTAARMRYKIHEK